MKKQIFLHDTISVQEIQRITKPSYSKSSTFKQYLKYSFLQSLQESIYNETKFLIIDK